MSKGRNANESTHRFGEFKRHGVLDTSTVSKALGQINLNQLITLWRFSYSKYDVMPFPHIVMSKSLAQRLKGSGIHVGGSILMVLVVVIVVGGSVVIVQCSCAHA